MVPANVKQTASEVVQISCRRN